MAILAASGVALRAQDPGRTEQAPVQFGGNYSGLDARRQKLVAEWVARFNAVTGVKIAPRRVLRHQDQTLVEDHL